MFGGIRLTFIGVEGGFLFFVVLPPSVFDLLRPPKFLLFSPWLYAGKLVGTKIL